mmetsp:Transcript_5858/g.8648  ORF Transcript_5858/g.8648 Transcript_5858/m.8648 type:complete len:91 (-) Transcript_5858:179-451(-)
MRFRLKRKTNYGTIFRKVLQSFATLCIFQDQHLITAVLHESRISDNHLKPMIKLVGCTLDGNLMLFKKAIDTCEPLVIRIPHHDAAIIAT